MTSCRGKNAESNSLSLFLFSWSETFFSNVPPYLFSWGEAFFLNVPHLNFCGWGDFGLAWGTL